MCQSAQIACSIPTRALIPDPIYKRSLMPGNKNPDQRQMANLQASPGWLRLVKCMRGAFLAERDPMRLGTEPSSHCLP